MADRWLYIHAGAAHGPVDLEKLAQLAALGKLLATDPVWKVGEDRRSAVEAHTLVKIESSPPVKPALPQATPPKPTSATPDWLADVASSPPPVAARPDQEPVNGVPVVEIVDEEPVVEIVEESPAEEIITDVQVVKDKPATKAPPPTPPKPPTVSKPSPSAASKRPAAAKGKPAQEDDDAEEGAFDFKRRDLLMFGLGVIGIGVAVGAGLFFAKISQRKADEDSANDDADE